jgi:hypothetical protein
MDNEDNTKQSIWKNHIKTKSGSMILLPSLSLFYN